MNIIERARDLLLHPNSVWTSVASENTGTKELYLKYILPLAAIGPIASFVGVSILGYEVPLLGALRVPIASGLAMAVVSYVLALIGVYVFALVVDTLAPRFGGTKDLPRALRLVAYSFTPAWLAGVLLALPALGVLALLAGLYGIYMLYRGLPVLMKSDVGRALPYTVASVVSVIVIQVFISVGSSSIAGFGSAVPVPAAVADSDALQGLNAEQRAKLERLKAIAEDLNKGMDEDAAETEAQVNPLLTDAQRTELERLKAFGDSLNESLGEQPDGGG